MKTLLSNCRRGSADAAQPWSLDGNFKPRQHKVWFTESGLPVYDMSDKRLINGINVILNSTPESAWFPTPRERAQLLAARDWLLRKAR